MQGSDTCAPFQDGRRMRFRDSPYRSGRRSVSRRRRREDSERDGRCGSSRNGNGWSLGTPPSPGSRGTRSRHAVLVPAKGVRCLIGTEVRSGSLQACRSDSTHCQPEESTAAHLRAGRSCDASRTRFPLPAVTARAADPTDTDDSTTLGPETTAWVASGAPGATARRRRS
jgi:hypothetical protein